MTRPTQDQIFMRLATEFARRSTCSRAAVGTVISTPDYRKIVAIGHNGNATGLANQCDSMTPGGCGCLHAEENACIHCDCPRETPKIVFTTASPCVMCAKRLINLGGVVEVKFARLYRNALGLSLLRSVGIITEQLS